MIVDELILKLQADLSDVKKKLAQVEGDAVKAGKQAGEAMGKAAGTSFGDVFNAIAGAAVLNTVKNFYSRAAAEFNKFEAAFLRVDSIAKGFGRSVETARKQVEQLADKGFLNLNQAASSYADAIALGFDEKQARKFIDSLSDIAAFQNTIGDGAAAVQSGLAGLLSNSAEKVENIGVPVKVLNMAYNENIKTMGKAAALQKFYNGILKESEKFQGDAARAVDTLAGAQNKANAATDKAMVAIGKGLEPTLKKLYNTVEDLALGFTKWFSSLDTTSKTVALMVPVIVALTIAFGTLLPILKAISLTNPFGWLAAAITGAGALIVLVRQLNKDSNPEAMVNAYKESAKALKELGDKAKELQGINKRTADQERELIDVKEQLRKKAKALGVDYDNLAKSAKNAGDMAERLTNIEREQKALALRTQREDLQRRLSSFDAQEAGLKQILTPEQLAIVKASAGANANRGLLAGQLEENILQTARLYQQDAQTAGAPAAAAAAASKAVQARFVESQAKLLEIEKNRLFTINNIRNDLDIIERTRQVKNANDDAKFQRESLLSSLRTSYAEFIEDKYMADMEALQERTRQEKRASEERLSAEILLAKGADDKIFKAKADNRARLAKIDEANARKQVKIAQDALLEGINSANRLSQAAAAFKKGDVAGGIAGTGAGISGVGKGLTDSGALDAGSGLAKGIGQAGFIGAAMAGLITFAGAIFGKSEEQMQQERAERQRQHEEALKILEEQANYQKSMLALQEAAAKLPFENLQRQLRLIDIESQQATLQGGDANTIEAQRLTKRQTAIQGTLTSQSGAIAGGQLFGDVQSDPESLIKFLSDRGAQSLAIQQFIAGFQAIDLDLQNPARGDQQIANLLGYRGQVPDSLMQVLDDYIPRREQLKQRWAELFKAYVENASIGGRAREAQAAFDELTNIGNNIAPGLLAGARGSVNALGSEISADTGVAENLLSTLEQSLANQKAIKDATQKTADNTSKALELRPDRERSFIDVGRGFIQSLGQVITTPSAMAIAQNLASQNLSIPAELGTATTITGRARTLQERMADALERQLVQGAEAIDIAYDMRAALYDLLAVLDANPNTSGRISITEFTRAQSEVNRRRV